MSMPASAFLPIIVCLVALTVSVYTRRKANFLTQQLYNTEKRLARIVSDSADAAKLQMLIGADIALPRVGGWTFEVSALHVLLRLIEQRKPKLVVELGSGLSSVAIASKLRDLRCGRLLSIDHDPAFVERSRFWLALNGLDNIADVRLAPLRNDVLGADCPVWYDPNMLQDVTSIDLLVVDGPPKPVNARVRAPALPFFKNRFAEDWLVFLDDADRPGE